MFSAPRALGALTVILCISAPLSAGCPTPANRAIGGRATLAAFPADYTSATTLTYIDFTRPATDYTGSPNEVTFAYYSDDASPFQVSFSVIAARGTSYTVVAKTPPQTFTPAPGVPSVGPIGTAPPQAALYTAMISGLQFAPGNFLGISVTSATPYDHLMATTSDLPGGYAFVAGDLATGDSIDRDSALKVTTATIAAEAAYTLPPPPGAGSCPAPPATQLIIPAVGDVNGAVHYTTDLTLHSVVGGAAVQFTLKDRVSGSVNNFLPAIGPSGVEHLTGLPGVPPPYFGPLILTISTDDGNGAYDAKFLSATARIVATTASGQIGSSLQGVGCDGIGRRITIPFHVEAGQRLNVGVASAQLISCGVANPAKAVLVSVGHEAPVLMDMSAESLQWNNVTGPNSPIAAARGLNDGVITLRVVDEAARITGYASVIDNQSQDATIVRATVVE